MAQLENTTLPLSDRSLAIGTPRGPDALWRALTDVGNAALARGDVTAASESYELAVRLKRQAVERPLEIAADCGMCAPLRVNCARHLKYALAFLAEATASGPPGQAGSDALMSEARRVISAVMASLQSLTGFDDATPVSARPMRH